MPRDQQQLPVAPTESSMPVAVKVKNVLTVNRCRTGKSNLAALWELLDLILEASAIAQNLDPEIADLAMLPALAIAERVGLPDAALYRMRESAVAEANRIAARRSHRRATVRVDR
jgi:hypothetical protein